MALDGHGATTTSKVIRKHPSLPSKRNQCSSKGLLLPAPSLQGFPQRPLLLASASPSVVANHWGTTTSPTCLLQTWQGCCKVAKQSPAWSIKEIPQVWNERLQMRYFSNQHEECPFVSTSGYIERDRSAHGSETSGLKSLHVSMQGARSYEDISFPNHNGSSSPLAPPSQV